MSIKTPITKHTPGPWVFTIEHRGEGWPGEFSIKDESGILSYGLDGEEGIYADNLADIELIATAPDMLEALELLSTYLEEWALPAEARMYVFDAINKAKGIK